MSECQSKPTQEKGEGQINTGHANSHHFISMYSSVCVCVCQICVCTSSAYKLYDLCISLYIYIVVGGLRGVFREGILPHHIITSYFTITSSFIFTHHFTKKNHIHQPISCTHLIIIFQLHFSSHHFSHQKKSSSFIFHYHLIII